MSAKNRKTYFFVGILIFFTIGIGFFWFGQSRENTRNGASLSSRETLLRHEMIYTVDDDSDGIPASGTPTGGQCITQVSRAPDGTVVYESDPEEAVISSDDTTLIIDHGQADGLSLHEEFHKNTGERIYTIEEVDGNESL